MATDKQMSEDSLLSLYRIPNKSMIDSAKSQSHSFLEELSSRGVADEQLVSATLVFDSGLLPEKIEEIVLFYEVELSRAETKMPIGDDSGIFTMSIGSNSILMRQGPISEKLRMSVGSEQLAMMKRLSDEGVRDSKYYDATLNPNPRFYKIEVIGMFENVYRLANDTDVSGVIIREDSNSVENYLAEKERITTQRTGAQSFLYRPLSEGLPPGVNPDQVIYLRQVPSINDIREIQSHNGRVSQ